MDRAAATLLTSVEDYLRHEADGVIRHEYIGGRIHAMAGTSEAHNLISVNLVSEFRSHVRGGPCKAYMADFKVRLEINREDIFYYPDVMVACQRVGVEQYYLRYPTLIVEVLSPSTESIDRREKLLNYPQISTMEEYAIVAQDTREVTIHRRAEDWAPRVFTELDAIVEFRSIKFSLPLSRIYEGVL
jgi:Uma2 family endonuclease